MLPAHIATFQLLCPDTYFRENFCSGEMINQQFGNLQPQPSGSCQIRSTTSPSNSDILRCGCRVFQGLAGELMLRPANWSRSAVFQ